MFGLPKLTIPGNKFKGLFTRGRETSRESENVDKGTRAYMAEREEEERKEKEKAIQEIPAVSFKQLPDVDEPVEVEREETEDTSREDLEKLRQSSRDLQHTLNRLGIPPYDPSMEQISIKELDPSKRLPLDTQVVDEKLQVPKTPLVRQQVSPGARSSGLIIPHGVYGKKPELVRTLEKISETPITTSRSKTQTEIGYVPRTRTEISQPVILDASGLAPTSKPVVKRFAELTATVAPHVRKVGDVSVSAGRRIGDVSTSIGQRAWQTAISGSGKVLSGAEKTAGRAITGAVWYGGEVGKGIGRESAAFAKRHATRKNWERAQRLGKHAGRFAASGATAFERRYLIPPSTAIKGIETEAQMVAWGIEPEIVIKKKREEIRKLSARLEEVEIELANSETPDGRKGMLLFLRGDLQAQISQLSSRSPGLIPTGIRTTAFQRSLQDERLEDLAVRRREAEVRQLEAKVAAVERIPPEQLAAAMARDAITVKRKPGRPRGSKNKPKVSSYPELTV